MEPFSALWFVIMLIAGFIASILGVTFGGSSLVMVPLLANNGIDFTNAVATVSFAVIFLSLTASVTLFRRIKLDLKVIFPLIVATFIGAIFGSFLLLAVNEIIVKRVIGILLIVMAVVALQNKDFLKERQHEQLKPVLVLSIIISFLIGVYWGFIGGDSALILVQMLMIMYTLNFIEAVAITRIIGLFAALSSTIVFGFKGEIIYPIAIPLAAVMALGGVLGARFIMRERKSKFAWAERAGKAVHIGFTVIIILLSARLLFF